LRLARGGHDHGGARVLQADGAGLWKERNATITLLLSDHDGAGSPACNQEFIGHRVEAAGVGSCTGFTARVSGGSNSGVDFSPVGVRYTLATRVTSLQHFRPENLIFFLLSC